MGNYKVRGPTTKPCSSYPECKHKKHGYTRKDHPEPKPKWKIERHS